MTRQLTVNGATLPTLFDGTQTALGVAAVRSCPHGQPGKGLDTLGQGFSERAEDRRGACPVLAERIRY